MENVGIVFAGKNDVRLEPREIRRPDADEVLLRTKFSLISIGTELTILSGNFPEGSAWADYAQYPFLAGYSAIGEVVAAGKDVAGISVGDLVSTATAHERFATTKASAVVGLGDRQIPLDSASFMTLGQVAMNGVRRARVHLGDSVVVFGAGIVGQLAAFLCGLSGARPVVLVDISEARLATVPGGTFVHTVCGSGNSVKNEVRRLTGGRFADIVLETTGEPSLIPHEFDVMKESEGRLVLLSSPRGKTQFDFHDLCNRPSHTIIGAHNGSTPKFATPDNPWTSSRNGELFLDLLGQGDLDVERLITRRVDWSAACDVYRELIDDRSASLGVVIDWGAEAV